MGERQAALEQRLRRCDPAELGRLQGQLTMLEELLNLMVQAPLNLI
jgi:hypothetical protein